MKNYISIGSDHAGFELKEKIKKYLLQLNLSVYDKGCFSNESCDYADFAHDVCVDINTKKADIGILICGSGNGINMAANKWQDIRSALCWKKELAELARLHNDANVLVLPGRFIEENEAILCVDIFLQTEFEGGRHQKRIEKIKLTNESDNFFYIPRKDKTPHISLNKEIGKLNIYGRSISENPLEFYQKIQTEVDGSSLNNLQIQVDLEYFNSASSKCLFDFFNHCKKTISTFDIIWFVEESDEDTIELVENIQKFFSINLILKQDI